MIRKTDRQAGRQIDNILIYRLDEMRGEERRRDRQTDRQTDRIDISNQLRD